MKQRKGNCGRTQSRVRPPLMGLVVIAGLAEFSASQPPGFLSLRQSQGPGGKESLKVCKATCPNCSPVDEILGWGLRTEGDYKGTPDFNSASILPIAAVGGLFDPSGFPPRWRCGTWSEALGWTHIVSDLLIFGAYTAIPLVLMFFILRRPDVPFHRIFWLFGAFIFSCGAGHLVEATIFWWPIYRFSGFVKAFTAAVSLITVFALIRITPQALHLPGLGAINAKLQKEIETHRITEEELRSTIADLERFNTATVEREKRMMGLKQEVNELAEKMGKPAPYDLSFVEEHI